MFDLTNVEVTNSFDLIKKGSYVATIVNAEIKASKAGNNYIELQFDIVSGEYKGRKLFHIINHAHSNPEVVSIAMQSLKGILLAVASPMFNFDTESKLFAVIMHKPMTIRVDIKVSKDAQYPDKNVIKGFTKYISEQPVLPAGNFDVPF